MSASRLPRSGALLLPLFGVLLACGGDAPPQAAPEAALQGTAPASAAAPATDESAEGLGYTQGSPDAPVTVVEFSDFGCPYCAQFAMEVHPALHREFVETGQVRWRFVPFVLGIFPNGDAAARAGECAGDQDRFWPMHDLLYQRQREWKSDAPAELFVEYARAAGLDTERFRACLGSERTAERIERNNRAAERAGVRATPSFVVNGRPVEGALPLEHFRMLLHWSGAAGGAGR
jgi:protein-disulfide isomerase